MCARSRTMWSRRFKCLPEWNAGLVTLGVAVARSTGLCTGQAKSTDGCRAKASKQVCLTQRNREDAEDTEEKGFGASCSVDRATREARQPFSVLSKLACLIANPARPAMVGLAVSPVCRCGQRLRYSGGIHLIIVSDICNRVRSIKIRSQFYRLPANHAPTPPLSAKLPWPADGCATRTEFISAASQKHEIESIVSKYALNSIVFPLTMRQRRRSVRTRMWIRSNGEQGHRPRIRP